MGILVDDTTSESKLTHLQARVDNVHVEGVRRTKDDFISSALKDIFTVTNFQELVEKSVEARLQLERLGCFKNISIVIDTSSGAKSTPSFGYDVTFNVVELNRIAGRIDTAIEHNQGTLGFAVQTPNVNGRGEMLQSEVKYSSKKMQTFNTSFSKPLLVQDGSFLASVFKQTSENIASGYKLHEYGGQFGLTFLYGDSVNHTMEYEGIVRNMNVADRNVAFPTRENAGYTLKSSVRNTIGVDSRNSTIFPTAGSLLQLKSEFAGLGGNIGFFKNELLAQKNIPLILDTTLQGSFGCGVMTSITKDKFYSLNDRFFIGGPLTLRGFQLNSVGPKVESYANGGTMYWMSAVHLYTPLPHRPAKGSFGDSFRIHLFCNGGNLIDASSGKINESFESLGRNFRLSYGIGLAYRLGNMARIELNYCIPVYYQADDKLIDGVQLGLGVQFI